MMHVNRWWEWEKGVIPSSSWRCQTGEMPEIWMDLHARQANRAECHQRSSDKLSVSRIKFNHAGDSCGWEKWFSEWKKAHLSWGSAQTSQELVASMIDLRWAGHYNLVQGCLGVTEKPLVECAWRQSLAKRKKSIFVGFAPKSKPENLHVFWANVNVCII